MNKQTCYKLKYWNDESFYNMGIPCDPRLLTDRKNYLPIFEELCSKKFKIKMKFKNFNNNDACLGFDIVFNSKTDLVSFLCRCYNKNIVNILVDKYYKNGSIDILKAANNEVI